MPAAGRPRERLLAAANELFYAEGIQTVGVDRIIEHAGVSRASFYNNFESKEQLIHRYLLGQHERAIERMRTAIASAAEPRDQILAVFVAHVERLCQPGFNGCAFVAASTEAEPGGLVDQDTAAFRSWIRTMFVELASAAGAKDADRLGRQLHLLYDGASLASRMDHDPAVAAATCSAVEALLDRELA